jgi:hypothetical protein
MLSSTTPTVGVACAAVFIGVLVAVRRADGACAVGGASAPSMQSPALAVCSAYTESACCDMSTELALTISLARSAYAAAPACHLLLLDLECGVSCHPYQSAFVVPNVTVRLCASLCTSLHSACAAVDNATSVPAADWCEGLSARTWFTAGYNTTVVADSANGTCFGGRTLDGCDGLPNSGAVHDRCGVCGGDNSTCAVPGAATVATVRANLGGNLTAFRAASGSSLRALASEMGAQTSRLGAQAGRAAAAHASNLSSTRTARAALQTAHTASLGSISQHTSAMGAALAAARAASASSLAGLATATATERTRVLQDYQRVNDSVSPPPSPASLPYRYLPPVPSINGMCHLLARHTEV